MNPEESVVLDLSTETVGVTSETKALHALLVLGSPSDLVAHVAGAAPPL